MLKLALVSLSADCVCDSSGKLDAPPESDEVMFVLLLGIEAADPPPPEDEELPPLSQFCKVELLPVHSTPL